MNTEEIKNKQRIQNEILLDLYAEATMKSFLYHLEGILTNHVLSEKDTIKAALIAIKEEIERITLSTIEAK